MPTSFYIIIRPTGSLFSPHNVSSLQCIKKLSHLDEAEPVHGDVETVNSLTDIHQVSIYNIINSGVL